MRTAGAKNDVAHTVCLERIKVSAQNDIGFVIDFIGCVDQIGFFRRHAQCMGHLRRRRRLPIGDPVDGILPVHFQLLRPAGDPGSADRAVRVQDGHPVQRRHQPLEQLLDPLRTARPIVDLALLTAKSIGLRLNVEPLRTPDLFRSDLGMREQPDSELSRPAVAEYGIGSNFPRWWRAQADQSICEARRPLSWLQICGDQSSVIGEVSRAGPERASVFIKTFTALHIAIAIQLSNQIDVIDEEELDVERGAEAGRLELVSQFRFAAQPAATGVFQIKQGPVDNVPVILEFDGHFARVWRGDTVNDLAIHDYGHGARPVPGARPDADPRVLPEKTFHICDTAQVQIGISARVSGGTAEIIIGQGHPQPRRTLEKIEPRHTVGASNRCVQRPRYAD